MRLWIKITICVVAIEVLGGLSGYLTASSIKDWFTTLNKPPGNPPNWVFGPVWTTLYAMIGISLARIWHLQDKSPLRQKALLCFFLQMLLNLAWTPVFFGAHHIAAALAVIITLLILIAATIVLFRKLDKPAAFLLVPYLLWVSYATYLNAAYLALN